MGKKGKKTRSIRRILLSTFIISTFPILILMILISQYSIRLNLENAYQASMNILASSSSMVDKDLSMIQNILLNAYSNSDRRIAMGSENDGTRIKAYSIFQKEIITQLEISPYLNGVEVLSTNADDSMYVFSSQDFDFEHREKVLDYISDHREELYGNGKWTSADIDGEWVLLNPIGNSDTLIVGWIWYENIEKLLTADSKAGYSTLILLSDDGEVREGNAAGKISKSDFNGDYGTDLLSRFGNKYVLVALPSDLADFQFGIQIDRDEVAGMLYNLQVFLIVIIILYFAVLLPHLFRELNICVFRPIYRMENAMKKVETGDLNVEIPNAHSSREMDHLINSFNSMIRQVRDLKITSYEEKLENQKLQLNYLLLQIEPHFYLNALNLINTMAQVGDTELIRDLTMNLATYMRYIVNTRSGKTTVEQEISHIGNYLRIMEIRMGDTFHYVSDVDESLNDLVIPPLMIQMLVENSMKYAFNIYGNTVLQLRIYRENGQAVFLYHDNGPGFSEEILKSIGSGTQPEGNHIGLWNIKMRLAQMYPDASAFEIWNGSSENEEKGAWTKITIDLKKAQTKDLPSDEQK